jgi:hypothetical protein
MKRGRVVLLQSCPYFPKDLIVPAEAQLQVRLFLFPLATVLLNESMLPCALTLKEVKERYALNIPEPSLVGRPQMKRQRSSSHWQQLSVLAVAVQLTSSCKPWCYKP